MVATPGSKPPSLEHLAQDAFDNAQANATLIVQAKRDAIYRASCGIPMLCFALSTYLVCAGVALLL